MKFAHILYQEIISLEHLFEAWQEFKIGKRHKKDVQIFERNLEDNLFYLHEQLSSRIYEHSLYMAFDIYDPKFRHIHKATVADRVIHHAIVSVIEPVFDRSFIFDSYSCRVGKGTHRAVKRLFSCIRKVSRNYTFDCFALKLDIKKFFDTIDHEILLKCIRKKIQDESLLWLLGNIISSFSKEKGIPIGNLTSQIFANIYLNELDQFIKHKLKVKYYFRYADDFVILSQDQKFLAQLVPQINIFLNMKLKLSLHEDKIIIRKYTQGIDFLGYIILPHTILLRTKTKNRIFKKIKRKIKDLKEGMISENLLNQSLQSYLGYFSHANSYKLTQKLKNQIWFWTNN